MSEIVPVQWTKLVITGVPGMECNLPVTPEGRVTDEDGEPILLTERTRICGAGGAWMVGRVFLCREHAVEVAEAMGDSIAAIESEWRKQCVSPRL